MYRARPAFILLCINEERNLNIMKDDMKYFGKIISFSTNIWSARIPNYEYDMESIKIGIKNTKSFLFILLLLRNQPSHSPVQLDSKIDRAVYSTTRSASSRR